MIKSDGTERPLDIVFLGLSITSSWGNGHATNYRALTRALATRGHRILFLERAAPWYAANRDMPEPPGIETVLYRDPESLRAGFTDRIRGADLVVVGSGVPDGVAVGRWVTREARGVTAFYDIDTPITIEKLERGDYEYLSPDIAPLWDLYLSFSAGPALDHLRARWGVRHPRAFACPVDNEMYQPQDVPERWLLGYMGTFSADRQPALERFLFEVAHRLPNERFVIAGAGYPKHAVWPENVDRIDHLPPAEHSRFYNQQRFTLNISRRAMMGWGYSPSPRLFEAAACGVPVITDVWAGLDTFFEPGVEILSARTTADVLHDLQAHDPGAARRIGAAARARVLERDTARHRAAQLESLVREAARVRQGGARDSLRPRRSRSSARAETPTEGS